MGRSKVFLGLLISFVTGIGLHELLPYQPNLFGFFALLCLATSFLVLLKNRKIAILLLFCCALTLGIYRGQSTLHFPTPGTIDFYASEQRNQVTITGTIAEEPDVRSNKINYTISTQSMTATDSESPQPVSGYMLISTGKYPKYKYGNTLEVSGHLQRPTVFDGFDYAGYLSRFSIYSVMYRPRIERVEQGGGLPTTSSYLLSTLLKIKTSFESQLNQTFSTEPSSSFMAGLLMGSRKGIPEKIQEDFRVTGLSHIVAISGYNITLVVSIMMAVFRPLGRRLSIIISATAVILFTLFVGASPAVVRACIMGLIALVALNSERKGDVTIALALTATVMIGYNPKILFHDVGFQLSFLATMGLIYVSPLLEKYFQWLPSKLAIRESILLTLSAQIMALPIILYNFSNLSVISPLSNLLISGPFIPLTMLFGFLGTITSYIFLPLAKLIAFPAYLLMEYIVNITHLTASIPYASVEVSWFSKSLLFAYFVILASTLKHRWQIEERQHRQIVRRKLEFAQILARKVHQQ